MNASIADQSNGRGPRRSELALSSIEEAVAAIKAGRPVLVADDEDRENEGDIILSAQLATQETIAWTVAHSSGLLCAPMTDEIANAMDLPMMVTHNQDVRQTAYTVTVDAAEGVTTGISAHDRARTVNILADPNSQPSDVHRPGHVLPLRAVPGGVRARAGHTEASVELMKLAGLREVAVIAEVVAEDGEMMRLPGLLELGAAENVPVITIEHLIAYLDEHHPLDAEAEQRLDTEHRDRRVSLAAETIMPTVHGTMRVLAFRDRRAGIEHLALIGMPDGDQNAGQIDTSTPPLVRVHSECVTGESFGSLKCECGPQLDAALDLIGAQGGIVLYLRGHEGRGIGLSNKLRAYALQEQGYDTVDANTALGFAPDERDYRAAAEILDHLGITSVRLLTNNPDKVEQLSQYGITVTERVPLVVGVTEENRGYLATKRDKMAHLLPADVDAEKAH